MRLVVCALALIGCGRIDFDARGDAAAGGDDASSGFCTPGAPSGCPTGAAFCDDFETSTGATFPAWDQLHAGNWMTAGPADPGTTLLATEAMPCRGTRSAHGRGVGAAQAIYNEVVLARPNPLYLRLWFRLAGTSPINGFEMVGIHDDVDNAFVHIDVTRDAQTVDVNPVAFSTSLAGMSGPASIGVDRWQCMQMRWEFAATATGALQIQIDGVTAIDATNVITEGSRPMNQLILGVVTGMLQTGTYDVDIDEVAVADVPIPCS